MARFLLNTKQQEAVEHIKGPLVIIAGPGTGKTRTLVAKIDYLIAHKKIKPDRILALTFTKKAASEIRERLSQDTKAVPLVSTFHALGYLILSKRDEIKLITENERASVINDLKKNSKSKFSNLSVKELGLMLSLFKTSLHSFGFDSLISQFAHEYQSGLALRGLLDYDDLICKAYSGIKNNTLPYPTYEYILVDEFQDTTPMQYELVKLLARKKNICVIGDPLQSIYSFRGATQDIFDLFKKDFPNAYEVMFDTNYRSGKEIIEIATRLFPHAPIQHTVKNGKSIVCHITTLNEYTQADFIVRSISDLMGGTDLNNSTADDRRTTRFSDFAIIYRTHHVARMLEKIMDESGIPYQMVGGGSLYEEGEICRIINELELIPSSYNKKLSEHISEVIEKHNIMKTFNNNERRLRNIAQFKSITLHYDTYVDGLSRFLDYIQRLKENEYYDERADKVTLLTMHAAKGLEFAHVFIIGFEEGIIPYLKKGEKEERREEEKRLFYVALTRAKETLTLISRTEVFGVDDVRVSSFKNIISSLPLVDEIDDRVEKIKVKREKERIKKSQGSLF